MDESRKQFEKWVIAEAVRMEYPYSCKLLRRYLDSDIYEIAWVYNAWMGWKAHEALTAEAER